MNYFYVSLYVVICVIIFIILFISNETFNFFFEKIYNNIRDYNHEHYTGGIEYIFNPFRHVKCQKV
jgi:hypothetical protein